MKYFTEDVILKFQNGGLPKKPKTNLTSNNQASVPAWMTQLSSTPSDMGNYPGVRTAETQQSRVNEEVSRENEEYHAYVLASLRGNKPVLNKELWRRQRNQKPRQLAQIQADTRSDSERQHSLLMVRTMTPGTVEYNVTTNPDRQYFSDPNGTGTMLQATRYAIPEAAQAGILYGLNFLNNPLGTIGGDVAHTVDNVGRVLLSTPAAPVLETQALRQGINDGNGWDIAQHALMLGLSASPYLKAMGPLPTLSEVRIPFARAAQATRQSVLNTGAMVNLSLRNFGNQIQSGFDYTFGRGPILQPAYANNVSSTMRTPRTLQESTVGNYSQMNSLGEIWAGFKKGFKEGARAYKNNKPSNQSTTTPTTTPEFKYRGNLYDGAGNPIEIYRQIKQEIPESYWDSSTNQWVPFPQYIKFSKYYDVPVSEHTSATGVKFIRQPNGKYKVIDEYGNPLSLEELTPADIQRMYAETIPVEALKEYISPTGDVFGRYKMGATRGLDTRYSYEKVKMNEDIDPTETYYDKEGHAYDPNTIFYNSEGRPYKNWRTGELAPLLKNRLPLWPFSAAVATAGTIWGINNENRQQQVNDSIQRAQQISDSILAARQDSISYNANGQRSVDSIMRATQDALDILTQLKK